MSCKTISSRCVDDVFVCLSLCGILAHARSLSLALELTLALTLALALSLSLSLSRSLALSLSRSLALSLVCLSNVHIAALLRSV
jgi:hypothetical protein